MFSKNVTVDLRGLQIFKLDFLTNMTIFVRNLNTCKFPGPLKWQHRKCFSLSTEVYNKNEQCMTQFGIYSDFKMTQQEVDRVANLPEWATVLEVMIKSRRADLAFRTTKQEQWNQRAQDRQAHQDFLEEHRGTVKFSGKYAPQPQQTELI